MTRDDYEKYKKLNEEVENIKTFLFYCGKRYRCKLFFMYYLFDLLPIKRFNKHFKLRNRCGDLSDENDIFDIPRDLQERIIDVIEDYVDEKERELEEL